MPRQPHPVKYVLILHRRDPGIFHHMKYGSGLTPNQTLYHNPPRSSRSLHIPRYTRNIPTPPHMCGN